MYRVPFMDKPQYREEAVFLSEGISQNLLNLITCVLGSEFLLDMFRVQYLPDFFAGIGEYLPGGDKEAGWTLLQKKVQRMQQKLKSPVSYEPLDLFEQRLIYHCAQEAQAWVKDGVSERKEFVQQTKQRQAKKVLMERFGEEERVARRYSQAMYDGFAFLRDIEDEYEDTALVLDYDFVIFFGQSFVEGIRMLKSYAGEALGYGYDYACKIFSDADITPPLSLLGTAEANRIANEESQRRIREEQEERAKRSPIDVINEVIGPVDDGIDWDQVDDSELPFS